MTLQTIPNHVFLVIHSCLSIRPTTIHVNSPSYEFHRYYGRQEELDKDTDWKHFLNTTKLFCELKLETFYLSLNKTWSEKFIQDRIFCGFLNQSFLKNSKEQLALHFTDGYSLHFTN
jgi:hypothetical protein